MNQTVVILDFGGQYKELIARRVRELGVYSEIMPYSAGADEIRAKRPIGVIFSGGPDSVYSDSAPVCDRGVFDLCVPVLGICYGMQLIAHMLGGEVAPGERMEYGVTDVNINSDCAIFKNVNDSHMLMSHTDRVSKVPDGFRVTASTKSCPVAAFEAPDRRVYGFQFHPEVELTPDGAKLLHNFLYDICQAKGDYTMDDYLNKQLAEIKSLVGDGSVLLGLSGGVDSSVCAAIISRAIGRQLTCVYIDHGFMRKGETERVKAAFSPMDLNLKCVDASDEFIGALQGVIDPEQKRKIIGAQFVRAFEREAKALGKIDYLAQGTIYPDVVESGANKSALIKSHHNVGGLPKDLGFKGIIEPLRGLFKDEVRSLGRMLGLPESIVSRQPFPGPGLAVRTMGEITREKLEILKNADYIVRDEIDKLPSLADQYFAVLTNQKSVGVMGDHRTYDYAVCIRAVKTKDFMTAEAAQIPYETLFRISSRITNEVKGINRVLYDITAKPPATIEWE